MTTTTHLASSTGLDAAMDVVLRRREVLLGQVRSPEQAKALADLYRLEARLWSEVYEETTNRLFWRAALSAEAFARLQATTWRRRASELGRTLGPSESDVA
jgi:hypothetical protein